MEEKHAAEGNTTWFSELANDDLEKKLRHRDEDERTTLHVAAAAGHTELVEFFLTNAVGRGLVNKTDEEDWTPLHSAASCGHVGVVAALLAAGANPNAANSGGQRPAHYAASKGHLETLAKLVAAGADVAAADKTGSTPLHRAASQGRVNIVAALLDGSLPGGATCDVEARNGVRQTPLLVACEAGQHDAAAELARRGADPRAEDGDGGSVATLAPKLVAVLRAIREGGG